MRIEFERLEPRHAAITPYQNIEAQGGGARSGCAFAGPPERNIEAQGGGARSALRVLAGPPETPRLLIERLEPRHAAITPYLRKADVDEMNDGLGIRAGWGVAYSIACSRIGFAVMADGAPAALFGIGPAIENIDEYAKGVSGGPVKAEPERAPPPRFSIRLGAPWLLATPEIERHPVTFYRMSKRLFPRLASGYDRLVNWVDARNVLSLRWLAWLGFEAGPPAPWGALGLEFHKMSWEAK